MKIPSTHFHSLGLTIIMRYANPNFMNQTDRISAEILEFADYVFLLWIK